MATCPTNGRNSSTNSFNDRVPGSSRQPYDIGVAREAFRQLHGVENQGTACEVTPIVDFTDIEILKRRDPGTRTLKIELFQIDSSQSVGRTPVHVAQNNTDGSPRLSLISQRPSRLSTLPCPVHFSQLLLPEIQRSIHLDDVPANCLQSLIDPKLGQKVPCLFRMSDRVMDLDFRALAPNIPSPALATSRFSIARMESAFIIHQTGSARDLNTAFQERWQFSKIALRVMDFKYGMLYRSKQTAARLFWNQTLTIRIKHRCSSVAKNTRTPSTSNLSTGSRSKTRLNTY
ncbi:MAG: hypothetical protein JOS17DRAFT_812938 [Linnemannia elongata]|nr:MAG: hypothetical protein JOS17DRAFT_812938 [Linnemannia elongata]